ncbi:MAG: nitroreductase family protein [Treponema sp.]|jgi:nitroreductase|nr:nitroreductase family protein [Treponema sp.]
MKKLIVLAAVFIAMPLMAQEESILHHYAARNFTAGDVGKERLDTVLTAGVNAPSAMNRQPWRFTVAQDIKFVKQIIPDAKDGNVLIIVSVELKNGNAASAVLDCGLAVQSMYLAAQAVGLGSRIYTGPIGIVNGKLKKEIPAGHTAVAIVRIGMVEKADAVTAASSRKSMEKIVTYK